MHKVIASRTEAHADENPDLEKKGGVRGKSTGSRGEIQIGAGSLAGDGEGRRGGAAARGRRGRRRAEGRRRRGAGGGAGGGGAGAAGTAPAAEKASRPARWRAAGPAAARARAGPLRASRARAGPLRASRAGGGGWTCPAPPGRVRRRSGTRARVGLRLYFGKPTYL